jgi:solute carrier family 26 protein
MAGNVAEKLISSSSNNPKYNRYNDLHNTTNIMFTQTQGVAAVTLGAGFAQVVMGLLHLGTLSVLMSEVLISGFTTGSAIHVLVSQLRNMLGLNVPKHTEFPKLLRVSIYK